jgi:hypothetical protein
MRTMILWRWCAVLGLLTLLVGASFAFVPDIGACGVSAGAGQWADFQKVKSVAEVRAMIRPDCAAAFAPALEKSMWLDALGFIPVYGAFLALALVGLCAKSETLSRIGLILLGLGMIADECEGAVLLRMLSALPGTEDQIGWLQIFGTSKMIALSLATLVIGWLAQIGSRSQRILGWLIAFCSIIQIYAIITKSTHGSTGLLVAWLILTMTAILISVRKPAVSSSPL